jgi:hypothetical protein
LRQPVHHIGPPPSFAGDPLTDEDLQLGLYVLYELHYRSFPGVADGWEWEPSLLAFRRSLERAFEEACRDECAPTSTTRVADELRRAVEEFDGPSLSSYMLQQGTLDDMQEFAIHRSLYQLKEADPHTWAIPRLGGRAKAGLVQIQFDEYGGGDMDAMHSSLFAVTMESLGLDPGYGAYLDMVPGVTLATCNLASMFGLHRRLRGALAGHLTIFEMTSQLPMSRYAKALERFGVGATARHFYDVHVEADGRHQLVALTELATALADQEPALAADIVFGGQALMNVEARFAEHLLAAWRTGRSSLLRHTALEATA